MEQERTRAKTLNYEDPIHVSYQATCDNFNNVLNVILDEVKQGNANVMVASHNEESVHFTVKRSVVLMYCEHEI